jgi:hypothetical protein
MALQHARKEEPFIKRHLSKPYQEIWHELNGRSVYPVVTESKSSYQSIGKVKTFTLPRGIRHLSSLGFPRTSRTPASRRGGTGLPLPVLSSSLGQVYLRRICAVFKQLQKATPHAFL